MYNRQSPGVVSKQMLTYRRLNEAISVITSNVSSPVEFVPNHRNETLIGEKGPYQAIFRLHSGQVFPILIAEESNDSVESSYPHAFVLKESYFSGTEQVICMEHEREFVRDLRAWADLQWAISSEGVSANIMKAQKAPALPQNAYEIPPLPYVHKLPELPDSGRESFQIIRVLIELVPHKVKSGELEEARALYRKYKPTFPDGLQRFIDNRLKEAAVYAQIVGATT